MTETLTNPSLNGSAPEATSVENSQAESRGFRAEVRKVGNEAYSLLDLSADIANNGDDIRYSQERLDRLNERFGGILKRQTASDIVSAVFEADLILDYRRDAQRAGYTDVDAMPNDLRAQIVERAVRNRADDIMSELEGHHPDWTPEQLAEATAIRINDIITLLSMSASGREKYFYALHKYRETQAEIIALEEESEALRQERRQRMRAIGGVAVKAVMGLFTTLRAAPANVAAHATVAGMSLRQKVGEWFQNLSPEGKKATVFTAASVALAGIATYIGMRYGGYESGGASRGANFALASNDTDLSAHTITDAPSEVPSFITGEPSSVDSFVTGAPSEVPAFITGDPSEVPPFITGSPSEVPEFITGQPSAVPEVVTGSPSTVPEQGGDLFVGSDLRSAKTSRELFGNGTVQFWPDTIKVSEWDAHTKDGSLWGICRGMLQRSGVSNPSDTQIGELVDALRPQADAQGMLRQGQDLDLRPAIDLLPKNS